MKKKDAPTRIWTENLEEGFVLKQRTRDYAFWCRESVGLLPQDWIKIDKMEVSTVVFIYKVRFVK